MDNILLSPLGHIGVALGSGEPDIEAWQLDAEGYANNSVMEVLCDTQVIHLLNTLTQFKNKVPGKYWGAKYKAPDYQELTLEQAGQMLMVFATQFNYPKKTGSVHETCILTLTTKE